MAAQLPTTPHAPDTAPTPSQLPSSQRRTSDPSRLARFFLVLAAIMLEALPVAIWLAVLADLNGPPKPAAFSFGGILGVIGLAYVVALILGRVKTEPSATQPIGGLQVRPRRTRSRGPFPALLVILGYALTFALTLWLSPAAYGGLALPDAAATLANDLATTDGRFNALLGLLLVLGYLWWRGLDLGRKDLERIAISRRFVLGLAAIILAIVAAATSVPQARAGLETMFALALPAEVFFGLFASALAHALDVELENRGRRGRSAATTGQGFSRPWILTTVSISGSVVVLALIASLFVSLRGFGALFALLAPVGDLINGIIGAVTYAIAYVLYLVFNNLLMSIQQKASDVNITLPKLNQTCSKTSHTGICAPPGTNGSGIPSAWLTLGHWVIFALIVIVVVIALVAMLRRFNRVSRPQTFDEERSALDARALLGQQLRDLFRRNRPASAPDETLLPGSVRALYRDLLRATRTAGYPRQPEETPREYALRLAQLAGTDLPATALDELTRAYYPSRYAAANEQTIRPSEASPAVRDAFAEVSRWLRAHPATRTGQNTESAHGPARGFTRRGRRA